MNRSFVGDQWAVLKVATRFVIVMCLIGFSIGVFIETAASRIGFSDRHASLANAAVSGLATLVLFASIKQMQLRRHIRKINSDAFEAGHTQVQDGRNSSVVE